MHRTDANRIKAFDLINDRAYMWHNFGNNNILEMFERIKNKESINGYSNAGHRNGKISEEKRPPAEANTKKDVK